MNNKLIKNVLFYGIGDFVVTAVTAFLLIPLYLRFLTTSEYGILNILNNNNALLTYIFQFGVISAFSRLYFLRKNENREKNYVTAILFFHIIYSIALFLILLFFKDYIFGVISPSIQDRKFLLYPIAMAFFSFIPALFYALARMENKVSIFVYYQIGTITLLLLFLAASYFLSGITLLSIVLSFIATYIVVWGIVLYSMKNYVSLKINIGDILDTLKFGFPIFIGYIAYFLMSRYSLVVLQNHVSLKEIGMYSLAQQVAMIPTFISIAVSKALQPYIFSSKSDNELSDKAAKIDSAYKMFMLWLVACLIFTVDVVASFFFPGKYLDVINIIQILLVINLIYNFTLIENSILLYKLKSNILLVITVLGSIVNVALCNLLVVNLSINGILISMFVAYCLTLSLEVYFSRKLIKFRYDLIRIFFGLAMIASFLVIKHTQLFNSTILNCYRVLGILLMSYIFYSSLSIIKLSKKKSL